MLKDKKILFFNSNLRSGGLERRMVELLFYLKKNTHYKMHLVLTEDRIHYDYVRDLNIPISIINRNFLKKDPTLFFRFFLLSRRFKPDLIHAWCHMTAFYSIPSAILLRIPIINNQIADATPRKEGQSFNNIIWRINRSSSSRIIGNSQAGLDAHGIVSGKGEVIYNGVRLERFKNLPNPEQIKFKYGISTPFTIIMVASFSEKKDQSTYLQVAYRLSKLRFDVTFLAVGDGPKMEMIEKSVDDYGLINFVFTGKIKDVEAVVNACDIGMLLTNNLFHREGVPNAVIEYMALKKPVIATDSGGTKELIKDGLTGFLVSSRNDVNEIVKKIQFLLSSQELRKKMGDEGYKTILAKFSIKKMGDAFIKLYNEYL